MFRQRADATPALHVELFDDVLVVSGPDLDLVLTEVGDRLGPDAEVLDARREIVGGVAGFFGRERFTVEASPAPSADGSAGADDLDGRAEAAEAGEAGEDTRSGDSVPVAGSAPAAAHAGREPLDGPSFAKALANALAEAESVHPNLTFDAMDLLHDPAPEATTPEASGPEATGSDASAGDPMTSPGDPSAQLAGSSTVGSGSARVAAPRFERVRTLPDVGAVPTTADDEPASGTPASDPDPTTEQRTRGTRPAAAPAPAVEASWGEGSLLALGVPDMSSEELSAQLSRLVGAPPALPETGVVAVVGEPAAALATAELLAERAGLEPADVVLAAPEPGGARPAWLTVTDPADAAQRRRRWSTRRTPTVVAVAMNPGLDGLEWTRELLDALDPAHRRLAVPGWRRVEEVAPRLQALMPLDAIDLCTPLDPTAALEFLGLPVPVGTIEGRPATVDTWMRHLRSGAAGASNDHDRDDEEARA